MQRRSATDNLIILLTFGLLVYQTFTFFQNYYKYAITLGVFALVVGLYILKNGGILKIKVNGSITFLCVMVAVITVMGVLLKDETIVSMLGTYLPYVIWPILYAIVEPIMDKRTKRKFLLWFALMLAVSAVATLSVLLTDSDAARQLAGAAKDEERYNYYSRGVGGYGFVYGCCFLVFGFVIWLNREKEKLIRTALWVLIVVMLIMILYSSYTTALLLTLVLVLLSFYAKSKKPQATVIFALAVFAVIVLIEPILMLIHNVADNLELEWVVKRTSQLLDVEASGNADGLRRVQLYKISWNAFTSNTLLGAKRIGGHSMFLDHLAKYGVFGLLFDLSYIVHLNQVRKSFGSRIGLAFFVIMALMCINTSDPIMMQPMVLFAFPLMLSYQAEGDLEYENRNTDTLLSQ